MLKSCTENCFHTTLRCLKNYMTVSYCLRHRCVKCARMQVFIDLYSRIYYAMLCKRGVHVSFAETHWEPYQTSKLLTYFARCPILCLTGFLITFLFWSIVKKWRLIFSVILWLKMRKLNFLSNEKISHVSGSTKNLREMLILEKYYHTYHVH